VVISVYLSWGIGCLLVECGQKYEKNPPYFPKNGQIRGMKCKK
jgi:hypothetical protein